MILRKQCSMWENRPISHKNRYQTAGGCLRRFFHKGIDAVYYRSNNNVKGIIFNDGNYIYIIEGNIEKDELVKIAQNVE